MRSPSVFPSSLVLLLLMAAAVAVAKPWFFVPLRVETRYPNGDPHQRHVSTAGKNGIGVDSWAFVGSRNDPADDMENRIDSRLGEMFDWIMPAVREDHGGGAEDQVEAFLGLPAGISDNLSSASATLRNRLRNVSVEMEGKIAAIQEKLANDVSVAAQKVVGDKESQVPAKDETFSQLKTPGFFDSFAMVSSFLNQIANSVFLSPVPGRSSSRDGQVRPRRHVDTRGIGIGSSLDDTREVVLPSLGEAGEVFNAVVTSLLNAVTIYKYQDSGPDCAKRLLCESNRDMFAQPYTAPAVVTYGLNLAFAMTGILDADGTERASELLWAARNGRKGETDCALKYDECSVKL